MAEYFSLLLYSLFSLLKKPRLLLCAPILSTVALVPLCLGMLVLHWSTLHKKWHSEEYAVLYLQRGTPDLLTQRLIHTLENKKTIKKVQYISPQEGKSLLQHGALSDQKILDTLLESHNPLPAVLDIQIQHNKHNIQKTEELFHYLETLPEIDSISKNTIWLQHYQLLEDLAWRIFVALTPMAIFIFLWTYQQQCQRRPLQKQENSFPKLLQKEQYLLLFFVYQDIWHLLAAMTISTLAGYEILRFWNTPLDMLSNYYKTLLCLPLSNLYLNSIGLFGLALIQRCLYALWKNKRIPQTTRL